MPPPQHQRRHFVPSSPLFSPLLQAPSWMHMSNVLNTYRLIPIVFKQLLSDLRPPTLVHVFYLWPCNLRHIDSQGISRGAFLVYCYSLILFNRFVMSRHFRRLRCCFQECKSKNCGQHKWHKCPNQGNRGDDKRVEHWRGMESSCQKFCHSAVEKIVLCKRVTCLYSVC